MQKVLSAWGISNRGSEVLTFQESREVEVAPPLECAGQLSRRNDREDLKVDVLEVDPELQPVS